jgi:hypothetical protein
MRGEGSFGGLEMAKTTHEKARTDCPDYESKRICMH